MLATIDSIVKEMIITEDNPLSYYPKYIIHAINGVRELLFTVGEKNLKSVNLTIDTDTMSANLPSDYVNDVGISWVNSSGLMKSLVIVPRLPLYRELDDCGNEVIPYSTNDDRRNFSPTGNNQAYGFGGVGGAYGYGGLFYNNVYYGFGGGKDSTGGYRIDKPNNRVLFTSDTPTGSTIILEYITDGISMTGETTIDILCKEALKSWVRYQYALAKKQPDQELLRMNWIRERDRAIIRINAPNRQQFSQMWTLTSSMTK